MEDKIRAHRRYAIKIAKDFGYKIETINKIKNAETEIQIDNILASARHEDHQPGMGRR